MGCCNGKNAEAEDRVVEAPRKIEAPFLDIVLRRKNCRQCVVKHLSAALVINPEIALGYPENTTDAARHVERAMSHARGDDRCHITGAALAYAGWRADGALWHIHRAHRAIQDALSNIGVPLDRARVIGHLANAEEECWADDPALAERIRAERLKYMDNPAYELDLASLIP